MPQQDIAAIVGEVSSLAEQITEMPIYWRSRQTREGVEGMLQAAREFGAAADDAGRLDAALWVGEAYLLFSRSLPDTGHNERSTGWGMARQIAQLLGGPDVWERRAREEFS